MKHDKSVIRSGNGSVNDPHSQSQDLNVVSWGFVIYPKQITNKATDSFQVTQQL